MKMSGLLPRFPRKYFSVNAGTNNLTECKQVLTDMFGGLNFHDKDVIGAYESKFAESVGVSSAFSFGAGRMALYAILEALEIGYNDEVIIPAFTCVVVPNAIIYRGAKPIYVDIDKNNFNIDINLIEDAITPRTKALYAQHTFGIPCDMDAICELGKKYSIPVIEDCGHAQGAKYNTRTVGSLSDVAFFTTDHSKIINTHLGGMSVTNNATIAKKLHNVQSNSNFLNDFDIKRIALTFLLENALLSPNIMWLGLNILRLLNKFGVNFYFDDELLISKPTKYSYPCKLSALQSRIGLSQLSSLSDNLVHRRKIALMLERKLNWYGMSDGEINSAAWLRYSFMVHDRDEFIKIFSKRFDLGIWFTSIAAGRTSDFDKIGYTTGSCPNAEYVSRHIVNIPTHLKIPFSIVEREVNRNLNYLENNIAYEQVK